jgi:hypothetical protein
MEIFYVTVYLQELYYKILNEMNSSFLLPLHIACTPLNAAKIE